MTSGRVNEILRRALKWMHDDNPEEMKQKSAQKLNDLRFKMSVCHRGASD